jgi:hypothetical protein
LIGVALRFWRSTDHSDSLLLSIQRHCCK